jgi:hypothetical protein
MTDPRELQTIRFAGDYSGLIKVIGPDKMCFAVDPQTLEPVSRSVYDPYASRFRDGAIEVISTAEWSRRRWDISENQP